MAGKGEKRETSQIAGKLSTRGEVSVVYRLLVFVVYWVIGCLCFCFVVCLCLGLGESSEFC